MLLLLIGPWAATALAQQQTTTFKETHTSSDFPDGFPAYQYNGHNGFGIDVQSGPMCVESVDITLTSVNWIATSTATEPVVPRDSGLVTDCVRCRSDLTGVVTSNNQPVKGVNLLFLSDRGTPSDTFTIAATFTPTELSWSGPDSITVRGDGEAWRVDAVTGKVQSVKHLPDSSKSPAVPSMLRERLHGLEARLWIQFTPNSNDKEA